MDVDDIRPGEDFTRVIETHVAQSRVLLALIGDEWLSAASQDGRRRIDDPQDFVRREICAALQAGLRVIPVLVAGAKMPGEADLPAELRRLSRCQALELSDSRFDLDSARLIDALADGVARVQRTRRRIGPWAGAALAVAAVALYLFLPRPPSGAEASVDGLWRARVSYDWGATHEESFRFSVQAGVLAGSAGFLGRPRGIVEGRVDGQRIFFSTRTLEQLDGVREQTHRYRGEIAGDEIHFLMQTEGGFSAHPPVEFVARRDTEGAGSAR